MLLLSPPSGQNDRSDTQGNHPNPSLIHPYSRSSLHQHRKSDLIEQTRLPRRAGQWSADGVLADRQAFAAHELDGVAVLFRPGVPMAVAMLPEPMMLMMVMTCVPPLCLGHLAVMVLLA